MSCPAQPSAQPEIHHARLLGALLLDLWRTDLVFAVLPDAEELLVKGRALLGQIAETGAAQVTQAKLPVSTIETALALEQSLGNDGDLVRRWFGNTLYSSVGAA